MTRKQRRFQRRDLVHAAGCTHENCVVRRGVFDDPDLINEAFANGVRVPRSVVRAWLRALEERLA